MNARLWGKKFNMEDLDRKKRREVDVIALKAYCIKSHYSSCNPAVQDVTEPQKPVFQRGYILWDENALQVYYKKKGMRYLLSFWLHSLPFCNVLLRGFKHSLLYKYSVCFVMMLKIWNKKKNYCLNRTKFSHPIFIFNLSHSKGAKILKRMLFLVVLGFNKAENVNNICTILQQVQFLDDNKEAVH